MRVLVAGGTGVVGRQLIPLLAANGHNVTILARSTRGVPNRDAVVITADALERGAVSEVVRHAAPDAVVNLLTAIPRVVDPRHLDSQMALTNRLRTEGTANLLAAAKRTRFVSTGLAYAYQPTGGPVADEHRPLWVNGPRSFRSVVRALIELENRTAAAGGAVLRMGHLYGPGTAFAPDGAFVERLAAGRVPIVGHGKAVFSFLHTHDAATAIVAALDQPVTGVFNVVDDEPAYVHDWLPQLARISRAPLPKQIPVALARLAVGAWGVAYMTRIVGAHNGRARHALDWAPRYTTWRAGFDAASSVQPHLSPARWLP
jgi:nucleoside-diphosphate-sugar epimerase